MQVVKLILRNVYLERLYIHLSNSPFLLGTRREMTCSNDANDLKQPSTLEYTGGLGQNPP